MTSRFEKNCDQEGIYNEIRDKTVDNSQKDDKYSAKIIVLHNMTIDEFHRSPLKESSIINGQINDKLIPSPFKKALF